MQVHDDFDARLAAAVGPLVVHPVSAEAVRAGDMLGRQPSVSLAPMVAVAAVVVLGAAAVAVPRLAGPAAVVQPSTSPPAEDASVAALPHVRTADGVVYVDRKGDAVRLVLRRDAGPNLVLASKVEAVPQQDSSFISVTIVQCPASTGLKQPYYAFGQANNVTSSTFTFDGIKAVGSFHNDLYVVAITSDPSVSTWRAWIGEKESTGIGGGPESFGRLPTYGVLSDAGCYVDPN